MLFHVEKIKYCQSGILGKDKEANTGGRRNFLIKMLEVTTSEHFHCTQDLLHYNILETAVT